MLSRSLRSITTRLVNSLAKPTHSHIPIPAAHRATSLRTIFHHVKHNNMAIQPDTEVYRPFLLSPVPGAEQDISGVPAVEPDWTTELELDTTKALAGSLRNGKRLKVLVLYGSLRER